MALKKALLAAAFALLLPACSPTVTTHGNMLPPHKVAAVQPQVTTRADIVANWGPPTTVSPFDNNTWYYIGEVDSQKGIFQHDVEKRQLVKLVFDANDMVTEITNVDPKLGHDVDVIARKTPSAGKEYTIVQQFVGNLGKFNKSDSATKNPGSPQ